MTWDIEWELARVIYEGRVKEAWGTHAGPRLALFPKTDKERRGYYHGREVAEVDLALASARAVLDMFAVGSKA